jgi:hypothetical protein
MEGMLRVCLLLACALTSGLGQSNPSEMVEGKLVVREGRPSALAIAGRGAVTLQGDSETQKVLHDKRLDGADLKARGRFTGEAQFTVDPLHTKAMLVRKDGRLRLITYWCEICSIRTYSPGECWCCQRETTLDLRDPDAQ